MGNYKVEFSPRALKDLDRYPPHIALPIAWKIRLLEKDPHPRGNTIKRIVGSRYPLCRLRAGDYRVIFLVEGVKVIILRVIHRKELERALRELL